MKYHHSKFSVWLLVGALALVVPTGVFGAAKKPLKVFILAGQSNMQGHANVSTIDYISKDPKSAPMYHAMMDKDGNARTCERVWITYLSAGRDGNPTEKNGKLTVGFGATPEKIGPEFTFGLYLEKQLDEPILLIKTAWGGKSMHTDFRSPGAGPYEFNAAQLEKFKTQKKDLAAEQAAKAKETGHYYRLMMEHVKKVLADPKKYCPEYDAQRGYEVAGFAWLQGWNDLVDSGVYPNRTQPGGYDGYSQALAHMIRDVRKDLKTPQLPFVIGVLGVGGPVTPGDRNGVHMQNFRDAMAAPGKLPEFKGTVVNVLTEHCWDPLQTAADKKKGEVKGKIEKLKKDGRKFARGEEDELFKKMMAEACTPAELEALKGISNQGYHYLGSARILGGIGKEFAEALVPLQKK
jgi:alpha-galactosidase